MIISSFYLKKVLDHNSSGKYGQPPFLSNNMNGYHFSHHTQKRHWKLVGWGGGGGGKKKNLK